MRSAGVAVPDGLSRLLEILCEAEKGEPDKVPNYKLCLNPNPWAEPPEAVVEHGMTAVLTYFDDLYSACLLYTSPSPRDLSTSRMPSSA